MDGVRALLVHTGDAAERAAALAGITQEAAEAVRRVAVRVRATEATPWRSLAADAFRSTTASVVEALGSAAGELDGAGTALRTHGAAAMQRVEHLTGLLAVAQRLVDEGREDLARAALESLERAAPRSWVSTWR